MEQDKYLESLHCVRRALLSKRRKGKITTAEEAQLTRVLADIEEFYRPETEEAEKRHQVMMGKLNRIYNKLKRLGANVEWEKLEETDETTGWRRLFCRKYKLPNGKIKGFDITENGDSCSVLAITEDEQVILVKLFRPGPEKVLLELPGGLVDEGETPSQCVARELTEETGYSVGEVTSVGWFWTSAYACGKKHAFLATGCKLTDEQATDEDEFIGVVLVPLTEFIPLLDEGQMVCAATGYRALKEYNKERP